jgi:RND family efflux transporter MFP subunit
MAPADADTPLDKLAIDRSLRAGLTRRRPWWRRAWVWVAAAAIVAAAAWSGAQRGRPVEVEFGSVTAAYPSQAIALLNATGHVSAARRASVSSKATGRLEWLGVQEGQRVARDEVIARLENRDVAAQRDQAAAGVEAARANLLQAEAEAADAARALARARDLAQRHFISDAEVDSAAARNDKARASTAAFAAQVGVAQANLHAAQVAVDQTLIKAPFGGVVLTKNANVGDILTPFSAASGTTGAVVTMADMSTLEVEADVSESSIAEIGVGTPGEISLDAFPQLRLAGSVSRIVPTVDRAKATLTVKVRFDETDPRVLPDMSAKVTFLKRRLRADERTPVPAVRPEAVVKRDGRTWLWLVAAESGPGTGGDPAGADHPATEAPAPVAGRARLAPVTIGAAIGDLVRVEGAAPGTRVLIGAPAGLREGARVTAAKK